MDEKISFKDPNGKHLSGLFNVSGGMITVTGPDGRTKTAGIKADAQPRDPCQSAPNSIAAGGATGRREPMTHRGEIAKLPGWSAGRPQ